MIRAAAASTQALMLRLRARAERIAAARAASHRPAHDWHSARALWPDLFKD